MMRLPIGLTRPLLMAALAALLLAGWGGQAARAAAPRYTDKENALELAQVLDKGLFRGQLIASTFVQSAEQGRFFIKAVLENGGEHQWDLHQLREFTKDGSLVLSKNRALVFPEPGSNDFGVLDKNAFYRRALQAQVYAKRYNGGDILAGRTLRFAIKQFNLVDLLELAPTTDQQGYRHHYVLDFTNGQRELLSYLEAWRAMQREALYVDAAAAEPYLRSTYRLQAVRGLPLERVPQAGMGRFGVELVFDRPVSLDPDHFPFRLFEARRANGSQALDNDFMLEVTAPNTVLLDDVGRIDTLEFLHDVHAVSDRENVNRVLLRAGLAPEVLTDPPEVRVQGETVSIVFTKVEDQSVPDRKALQQAEQRREQERLLAGDLSPAEVQQRRTYREHFETGMKELDTARGLDDFMQRYSVLNTALDNFRLAARNASSDAQLRDALRERNRLLVRLPSMVLEHARAALQEPPVENATELRQVVSEMLELSRDERLRAALQEVDEQLAAQ